MDVRKVMNVWNGKGIKVMVLSLKIKRATLLYSLSILENEHRIG